MIIFAKEGKIFLYFFWDVVTRLILSDDQCLFGCDFKRNDAHDCLEIFLKSHHGKYVVAEPNGDVNADRNEVSGKWEMWKVTFVGKDRVTFKSNRYCQKYLRAEIDGKTKANRDKAGNCEIFTVKPMAEKGLFSFKSYHGKYLVAEFLNGSLNANRCVAKKWETFQVIPVPKVQGKQFCLRAYSFRPGFSCG